MLGSRNDKIQLGMPGNLDASTQIPLLDVPATKVDRSMGDIHPQGNPHYWVPPDNALLIAHEIAERLESIDPGGAASYEANLQALRRRHRVAPRRLGEDGGAGARHEDRHLSQELELRVQVARARRGRLSRAQAGHPRATLAHRAAHHMMQREHVKVILMESFYPRSVVDLVAQKAGAKALVMPSDVGATPEIKDYFALVDAVVAKLAGK